MALKSAFTNFNYPTFGAGAPVLGTTPQDGPYFDNTTTPFTQYVYVPSTNSWVAVSGSGASAGSSTKTKFTSIATAGAVVAAAGDLSGADVTVADYTAAAGGGNVTLTTRTGTQMEADLLAEYGAVPAVGFAWLLMIMNPAANTLTLTAGASGITLTGGVAITTAKCATYVVKKTALNAYTFQSVALQPTF